MLVERIILLLLLLSFQQHFSSTASSSSVKFWSDGGKDTITKFFKQELDWNQVYWPHNADVLFSYRKKHDQKIDIEKQTLDTQLLSQIAEVEKLTDKGNLFSYFHNNEACNDILCTQTYLLYNRTECDIFIKRLIEEPVNTSVWIMKHATVSRTSGLMLFPDSKALLAQIANAGGCVSIHDKILVQPYITNPILTPDGHKISFQTHVLIANTNPLMVLYHDGVVWVAEKPFRLNRWNDKSIHFTNSRSMRRNDRLLTFDQFSEAFCRGGEEFCRGGGAEEEVMEPKCDAQLLTKSYRSLFKRFIVHTINTTKDIFEEMAISEYQYDYYDKDFYFYYHKYRYGSDEPLLLKKPKNRFHLLAFDFILVGEDMQPVLLDIQRIPATGFRSKNKEASNVFRETFTEMMEIELELLNRNISDSSTRYDLESRNSFHWLINEEHDPPYYIV